MKAHAIANFLERVYIELRNLGRTPEERALNYAASNAFQAHRVFESGPFVRPGSDCCDVNLTFFDPVKRVERARRVYRFTVLRERCRTRDCWAGALVVCLLTGAKYISKRGKP
jgi:hypothetical protein